MGVSPFFIRLWFKPYLKEKHLFSTLLEFTQDILHYGEISKAVKIVLRCPALWAG